jgi:hypothetical protein
MFTIPRYPHFYVEKKLTIPNHGLFMTLFYPQCILIILISSLCSQLSLPRLGFEPWEAALAVLADCLSVKV